MYAEQNIAGTPTLNYPKTRRLTLAAIKAQHHCFAFFVVTFASTPVKELPIAAYYTFKGLI